MPACPSYHIERPPPDFVGRDKEVEQVCHEFLRMNMKDEYGAWYICIYVLCMSA